jgi:hypothetical protein
MREKLDRRAVLKMSAAATALSTVPNTATAEGREKMTGVTYDTLTHQTGKNSNAQIERKNGRIEDGFLTSPGFRMELDELNVVDENPDRTRYRKVFSEQRYKKDDNDLVLDLYDWGDQLSGYVTRHGSKFGKRGLLLTGADEASSAHLRSVFTPNKGWMEMDKEFNLPKKGVPTETSPGRRIKFENGGE